ncbi:MAG TPA: cadherin-like beta sandwich domain-containing protein [Bacilli bacterium]|nr:cadherin-like beta sandwich domain-containing protein [Bacilli bacterium]
MKRIFKSILLLIIMIIPVNVFAYELSCDTSDHAYNTDFTCKITGTSNVTYDKLSGSIDSNDDITCNVTSISSGLTNSSTDTKSFDLTGTPTDENLVTYTCKNTTSLTSDKSVQLISSDFTYHIANSGVDKANEVLRSSFFKLLGETVTTPVDTRPRDTSNSQSRLKTIHDDNLNFVFSSFTTVYNIEVLYDVSTLNLKVVPNVEGASVRIDGSQDLIVGDNVIDIYVTSPDGSSTTCYTLNINRLPRGEAIYYLSKDSTLKSLSITGYDIQFDKTVMDYNIHLPYDVASINLEYELTNPNSSIVVSDTSNLINGSAITLTITSEDKTSTTVYAIHVTKDDPPANYSTYIYGAIIFIAILGVIILIIKTNQKNKKTNSLPTNSIPNVNNINTIQLNNNTSAPIQTQAPTSQSDFNKVTSLNQTLDLSNITLTKDNEEKK